MKHKDTNKLTRVAMLLLVALFSLTEARAGYEYGFEDGNLGADGWVLQGATGDNTGISASAARSGSYGFMFEYSEESAYLISPLLSGETFDLSFWYKEYSNSYGDEQFQVGYTTDASASDASAFTYGSVVTASLDWQEYTQTFPAGTKRIAIKYIYNDAFYLFLDDFSFSTELYKPRNLTVSPTTTQANATWVGVADSYNVRFRKCHFYENFENGIDEWTIHTEGEHIDDYSGWVTMLTGGSYAACAFSWYGDSFNADNWLISPAVDLRGTLSYLAYSGYGDQYEVLLSTSGTDIEDFTIELKAMSAAPTEWTEETIDLSGYTGQGYIAFHHVSEDCFYLGIDNIQIFTGDWTTNSTTETSTVLTGLNPETGYYVEVQAVYTDGVSDWTATTFTTHSATDAPVDLAATNVKATSATLGWVGFQESYNLRYRQAYFENFENVTGNNLPEGWTSIDNDGDGNNWYGVNMGAEYCHSGTGLLTSASYNGSALTPDNWLITPKVALDGTMSVWLRAQDPSWAAEHFAIYLSTTGTSVSDFTVTLVPETEATGEYVECTADLSAYAGQEGYIAIRHFNCTDMFRLNVDDFFIGNNSWTTVSGVTNPYTIEGLAPETSYQVQVQGILSDGTTEWSELSSFTTDVMPIVVELYDGEDNSEFIENDIAVGTSINVQLTGRTLFKDGSWNTICLPFDVTIADSPLAGATVMELDTEYSFLTASTLTLNFKEETTTIKTGKPYLIKWTSGEDITDPIFYDVTSPEDGWEAQDVTACDGAITFTGIYDPVTFEAGDESILYVGANNQLYFPSAEVTMNAFRAYFQIDESKLPSKHIALKFGDDDATGISTVEAGNGSETIYNVAGMRMSKALKGVNIVNGKKILK